MKLLGIIENDFVNYKKVSMTLEFPYCSFKCNKESGKEICQNTSLQYDELKTYRIDSIIKTYLKDDLAQAVVCQGLEPFDSFSDLFRFIKKFREYSNDDIVIYTGYKVTEISNFIRELKQFSNIIIKFGRFVDGQESHIDPILGVSLASPNQYAVNIADL